MHTTHTEKKCFVVQSNKILLVILRFLTTNNLFSNQVRNHLHLTFQSYECCVKLHS